MKYERIHGIYTNKELDDLLSKLAFENKNIIFYNENILDHKEDFSRISVTIIIGKINKNLTIL